MPSHEHPEHPSPQLDELPVSPIPDGLDFLHQVVFKMLAESTGADDQTVLRWLAKRHAVLAAEDAVANATRDGRVPADALTRLRGRLDEANAALGEAASDALRRMLSPQVGRFVKGTRKQVLDNLIRWGGQLPAGIRVCERCCVVFRPRYSHAYKCRVCHGRKDSPIQLEYRTNTYGHLEMPAFPVPLTPNLEALGFTSEDFGRLVVGVCQRDGCAVSYHVRWPSQRFCSDTCRKAAHKAKGRADRRSAGGRPVRG